MDFETTSPNGSQLLQQLKSTLAQYAPDYAEEAQRYEQAKDSLPDSTYPDALEAQFTAKLLYIAYQGFRWSLDCFQQPVNKLRINTDYEDLHQEQQLSHLPEVIRQEKSIHAAYEDFSPAQQEAAAQIGDYYAYLETVGFKIVHYWGFVLGNRMLPMLVPGFLPDFDFAAKYAHMISKDTDLPITAFCQQLCSVNFYVNLKIPS